MVPIPGASAVLAALTASGLPSDAFLFAGFLPVRDGQRRTRLDALKAVPATLIFFESPRRVADTLAAMADVLRRPRGGDRARTDQDVRGDAHRHARRAGRALCRGRDAERRDRGLRRAARGKAAASADDVDRLLLSLATEMPASKAAAEAARMTGGHKPELYRRLMDLKDGR